MSLFLRSSKLTAHTIRSVSARSIPSASIAASRNYNNINNNNSNFARSFQTSTSKMGVHNIASKAEFDSAIKENNVVVVDAFATWCGPCKVIAPQVHKFSEEYTSAHFVKIDVDEVPDLAQELSIHSMPTFLVFKGGEKVSEVIGVNPKALLQAIQSAVKAE